MKNFSISFLILITCWGIIASNKKFSFETEGDKRLKRLKLNKDCSHNCLEKFIKNRFFYGDDLNRLTTLAFVVQDCDMEDLEKIVDINGKNILEIFLTCKFNYLPNVFESFSTCLKSASFSQKEVLKRNISNCVSMIIENDVKQKYINLLKGEGVLRDIK